MFGLFSGEKSKAAKIELDRAPVSLDIYGDPEKLAREIVKISTSSYRRDIGIGCVDIENLISNLTGVIRALQGQQDESTLST